MIIFSRVSAKKKLGFFFPRVSAFFVCVCFFGVFLVFFFCVWGGCFLCLFVVVVVLRALARKKNWVYFSR